MIEEEVCFALVEQVENASCDFEVPRACITTVITRPLWRIFCRYWDWDENSEPTEWVGLELSRNVGGTRTIVIESEHFAAVSFRHSPQ